MAVTTTHNRLTYAGDGQTVSFPYDFRVFAASDLKVILERGGAASTLTLDGHYAVTGAGAPAGGNIVLTTPPPAGAKLHILRELPIRQEMVYPRNGPFPAESHEAGLDRLTMVAQQLEEKTRRTAKLPETATGEGPLFPAPAPNRGLKWSADGLLVNTACDPDASGAAALAAQTALAGANAAAQTAQTAAAQAVAAAASASQRHIARFALMGPVAVGQVLLLLQAGVAGRIKAISARVGWLAGATALVRIYRNGVVVYERTVSTSGELVAMDAMVAASDYFQVDVTAVAGAPVHLFGYIVIEEG